MSGFVQRMVLPGKARAAASDPGAQGRIGPNAISQLIAPLHKAVGPAASEAIFARAGIGRLLKEPPADMVPELAVRALFEALQAELGEQEAARVLGEAGEGTALYVLKHRIPAPVQYLLKALPAMAAGPLLLKAIGKHAWTFAGSGTFSAAGAGPAHIEIANNPIATPGCPWHQAVFHTLFATLVSPAVRVDHPECQRQGAHSCRFTVYFRT
jgi:divinyl protochlorophyllide a 8-vinyl-reductase